MTPQLTNCTPQISPPCKEIPATKSQDIPKEVIDHFKIHLLGRPMPIRKKNGKICEAYEYAGILYFQKEDMDEL